MVMASIVPPPNSSALYVAPSPPMSAMTRRMMSLEYTPGPSSPSTFTRIVGTTFSQVRPVPRTAAISV